MEPSRFINDFDAVKEELGALKGPEREAWMTKNAAGLGRLRRADKTKYRELIQTSSQRKIDTLTDNPAFGPLLWSQVDDQYWKKPEFTDNYNKFLDASQEDKFKALFSSQDMAFNYIMSLPINKRMDFVNKYLKPGGPADKWGNTPTFRKDLRKKVFENIQRPLTKEQKAKNARIAEITQERQKQIGKPAVDREAKMLAIHEQFQKAHTEEQQKAFVENIFKEKGEEGLLEYLYKATYQFDEFKRQEFFEALDEAAKDNEK